MVGTLRVAFYKIRFERINFIDVEIKRINEN